MQSDWQKESNTWQLAALLFLEVLSRQVSLWVHVLMSAANEGAAVYFQQSVWLLSPAAPYSSVFYKVIPVITLCLLFTLHILSVHVSHSLCCNHEKRRKKNTPNCKCMHASLYYKTDDTSWAKKLIQLLPLTEVFFLYSSPVI